MSELPTKNDYVSKIQNKMNTRSSVGPFGLAPPRLDRNSLSNSAEKSVPKYKSNILERHDYIKQDQTQQFSFSMYPTFANTSKLQNNDSSEESTKMETNESPVDKEELYDLPPTDNVNNSKATGKRPAEEDDENQSCSKKDTKKPASNEQMQIITPVQDTSSLQKTDSSQIRNDMSDGNSTGPAKDHEKSLEPNNLQSQSKDKVSTDVPKENIIPIYENLENPNQHDKKKRTNGATKFTQFESYDRAPFKIFLQNTDNNPDKINPLLINRFLIRKFQDSEAFDECYPISKNKVCITALNRQAANQVLNLKEWKLNNLEVFIPNHLMTRQGVIKNVPIYITEDEILENLVARDPHMGNLQVLNIRRFVTRRKNKEGQMVEYPTKTVQITFRGQYLPPRVSMYKIYLRVEAYCPQVRQCYRCFNFGHMKSNCKSTQELCVDCGEAAHNAENPCPRQNLTPQCKNCKLSHKATDRSCEVRKRQQEIRDIASNNNVSVSEAKKIFAGRRQYISNLIEFPALKNRLGSNDHQSQVYPSRTPNLDKIDSYAQKASPTQKIKDNLRSTPMKQAHRSPISNPTSQSYNEGVTTSPTLYHKKSEEPAPMSKNKISQKHSNEKYRKLEEERKKLLIHPSGHLPNMNFSQIKESWPPTASLNSTQSQNEENEELETNKANNKNSQYLKHDNCMEAVEKLLETMSIDKIYGALEALQATYNNGQILLNSNQRWPQNNKKGPRTYGKNTNDSQQWRLEYRQPLETNNNNHELFLSQDIFSTQENDMEY
ncbi:hypothetical protein QAD02_004896 [Eretmocerus hayati]|uniref:Uncharacterized protein n=1 Tax=Eretmocerus hayati TaxID=131215 RepID=A0ACC2NRB3_9HYME|nr:hypothetical protein QAD02_004896 [Eretmocerus hayati]